DTPEELSSSSVVRVACFDLNFNLPADLTSTLSLGLDETGNHLAAEVAAEPAPVEAPPPTSPLLQHLVESRSRIPVWTTGEATLSVVNIIEETHDSKTFRLS